MQRLKTQEDLKAAVSHLATVEPRFAGVIARHGLPALRHADPGLESLLRIVTDQLISLQAGAAIWSRLATRLIEFNPVEVLAIGEDELRALGLSAAKARTFRAAAAAFSSGPLASAEHADEAETLRQLVGIPGVGPWTASIYLLTALRAGDAWPAADLALQVAAQDLFELDARPSERQMGALAEPWRPCRSAAALLLWQHYRGLRGLPLA